MRHDACFQIVADRPCRDTAKVFIHVDVTAQERVHIHFQAGFHVRILTVRKRCYKEMNFDQFAGLSIDVVHVGAGPVNFAAFSRFMADPARQVVLEHVFGVAFVELCLSHGDCSPGSAFFYVLIVKELQRDTGFLQFFVNVFVVRGLEHHLFLMFIRIDDAVHLIFSEIPHICIMDPFFVGDAENLADRVP